MDLRLFSGLVGVQARRQDSRQHLPDGSLQGPQQLADRLGPADQRTLNLTLDQFILSMFYWKYEI